MDHPDYLEDEFQEEDWFVWTAGPSEYADLTKNENIDESSDEDEEYSDAGSDENAQRRDDSEGKQLDVVDPINHPVHFFPERPDNPEYKSIDPLHH